MIDDDDFPLPGVLQRDELGLKVVRVGWISQTMRYQHYRHQEAHLDDDEEQKDVWLLVEHRLE
jgi:hypothetical protein